MKNKWSVKSWIWLILAIVINLYANYLLLGQAYIAYRSGNLNPMGALLCIMAVLSTASYIWLTVTKNNVALGVIFIVAIANIVIGLINGAGARAFTALIAPLITIAIINGDLD
ncbi:MAG: hypothetical protein IJ719_22065 [Clostridia bacterium]|nr:hypothetical protein [Clostridia bacterium]